MTRRWKLSGILLLLAVPVGYGLVVRGSRQSVRPAGIDGAVGVLHVRSVRTGDGVSTLHEAWSDPESGDVAYKEWDAGGALVFHGVQRDPLVEQYWPLEQKLLQEKGLRSDVEGLPFVGGELLRYRVLVNGGDARWRITDQGADLWRLEGSGEAVKRMVWVDPTWYLPVREEVWLLADDLTPPRSPSDYLRRALGPVLRRIKPVERVAWEREIVEIVDRGSIEADVFRIDAAGMEPTALPDASR